jgi:hypothetical protein
MSDLAGTGEIILAEIDGRIAGSRNGSFAMASAPVRSSPDRDHNEDAWSRRSDAAWRSGDIASAGHRRCCRT